MAVRERRHVGREATAREVNASRIWHVEHSVTVSPRGASDRRNPTATMF